MKKNLKQTLAALLAAALLCICLAGCGSTASDDSIPDRPPMGYKPQYAPYITEESGPAADDAASADDSIIDTDIVSDTDATPEPSVEISVADTTPEKPMSDMESVAELGTLIGNWSHEAMLTTINYQFEMDKSDNPYGLTWHYSVDKKDPDYARLNGLYDNYVNACDWSLVFDAAFYKKAFPMLALQYNNDDALLEQHFQTVGVHEGRQGNEAFNLAAYMENCDDAVKAVFGDNYECYYFYYMLNQASESTISTKNENNAYPIWLTVELTEYQYRELEAVNKYRADVNAAPVTADPELMAFAC